MLCMAPARVTEAVFLRVLVAAPGYSPHRCSRRRRGVLPGHIAHTSPHAAATAAQLMQPCLVAPDDSPSPDSWAWLYSNEDFDPLDTSPSSSSSSVTLHGMPVSRSSPVRRQEPEVTRPLLQQPSRRPLDPQDMPSSAAAAAATASADSHSHVRQSLGEARPCQQQASNLFHASSSLQPEEARMADPHGRAVPPAGPLSTPLVGLHVAAAEGLTWVSRDRGRAANSSSTNRISSTPLPMGPRSETPCEPMQARAPPCTPRVTSPAALAYDIASCSSLEELSDLYRACHGDMDHWHLAAMWGRLPRACEQRYQARHGLPDSFLPLADDLVEHLRDLGLHRFGPRQLSNMLWVMACLQLGSRYQELSQQLLTRLLPPLEGVEADGRRARGGVSEGPASWCGTAWSAPSHHGPDRNNSSGNNRGGRQRTAQSLLAAGNAQDVSNTAWALARLMLDGGCPPLGGSTRGNSSSSSVRGRNGISRYSSNNSSVRGSNGISSNNCNGSNSSNSYGTGSRSTSSNSSGRSGSSSRVPALEAVTLPLAGYQLSLVVNNSGGKSVNGSVGVNGVVERRGEHATLMRKGAVRQPVSGRCEDRTQPQDAAVTATAPATATANANAPSHLPNLISTALSSSSSSHSDIDRGGSSSTVHWPHLELALRHLLLAAERTAPGMGPQELCNSVWAAAKLAVLVQQASGEIQEPDDGDEDGMDPEPPRRPATGQLPALDHLDPRSNGPGVPGAPVEGLGDEACGGPPPPPPPASLLPLLQGCLSGALGQRALSLAAAAALDRQHIPNLAWACARLGHRDAALLDCIAACAVGQLRSLTAQGLSMLLWAYARLGYRHEELISAVVRCATWKARKFRGRGLANLAWALTEFRHYDPTLYSLLAREALYKIDELRPLGLSTLLYAWSSSGYYNISLFSRAGTSALQQIHGFRPATLVRLMEACAMAGHSDPLLLAAAAARLGAWCVADVLDAEQAAVAFASLGHGLLKLLRREKQQQPLTGGGQQRQRSGEAERREGEGEGGGRAGPAPSQSSGGGGSGLTDEVLVSAEAEVRAALLRLSVFLAPHLPTLAPGQLSSVAAAVASCGSAAADRAAVPTVRGPQAVTSPSSLQQPAVSSSYVTSSPARNLLAFPAEFVDGIRQAAWRRSRDLRPLPQYAAVLWAAASLGAMDSALASYAAEAILSKLDASRQIHPKWFVRLLWVLAQVPPQPGIPVPGRSTASHSHAPPHLGALEPGHSTQVCSQQRLENGIPMDQVDSIRVDQGQRCPAAVDRVCRHLVALLAPRMPELDGDCLALMASCMDHTFVSGVAGVHAEGEKQQLLIGSEPVDAPGADFALLLKGLLLESLSRLELGTMGPGETVRLLGLGSSRGWERHGGSPSLVAALRHEADRQLRRALLLQQTAAGVAWSGASGRGRGDRVHSGYRGGYGRGHGGGPGWSGSKPRETVGAEGAAAAPAPCPLVPSLAARVGWVMLMLARDRSCAMDASVARGAARAVARGVHALYGPPGAAAGGLMCAETVAAVALARELMLQAGLPSPNMATSPLDAHLMAALSMWIDK